MKIAELKRTSAKLSKYVEGFAHHFGRAERRHWCKVYLSGLILDGDRKSVAPMANRMDGGNVQSLLQFVNQSPWNERELMASLRSFTLKKLPSKKQKVLVLDDTSLPKKGDKSVGVAHQYCGALGKLSNCQSVVTWHYADKHHHVPLSAQLYLPKSWTSDRDRLKKAGVPQQHHKFKEKWRIALDLLDELEQEFTADAVVFDAGYGINRIFLGELDKRKKTFCWWNSRERHILVFRNRIGL